MVVFFRPDEGRQPRQRCPKISFPIFRSSKWIVPLLTNVLSGIRYHGASRPSVDVFPLIGPTLESWVLMVVVNCRIRESTYRIRWISVPDCGVKNLYTCHSLNNKNHILFSHQGTFYRFAMRCQVSAQNYVHL